MAEGPYTKIGAIAGVISVAIALVALKLTDDSSSPARTGASASTGAQAKQPSLPASSPSPRSRLGNALTSIVGKWNTASGQTLDFTPSGNGPGSYAVGTIGPVTCGSAGALVTSQGHGLYSGSEPIHIHELFLCIPDGALKITIHVAPNGKTAVFRLSGKGCQNCGPVNMVRTSTRDTAKLQGTDLDEHRVSCLSTT
jgi:hypothetical protein